MQIPPVQQAPHFRAQPVTISHAMALTALFFLLLTHPSVLARPTLEITSHSQCLQGMFSSSKPLLEALLQAFLPLAPAITQLPAPLPTQQPRCLSCACRVLRCLGHSQRPLQSAVLAGEGCPVTTEEYNAYYSASP